MVHVGTGPVPQRVELGLPVHLDRDHHPVGHALRADIFVVDVAEVRQPAVLVLPVPVEDGLRVRVAVEELLPGGVDLPPDLGVGVARLPEQVPELAGDGGALPKVGLLGPGQP